MPPTSPAEFGKFLAEEIIRKLGPAMAEAVKVALREPAPAKKWDVIRPGISGPVIQQISLPQALADLTDQMLINNEMQRHVLKATIDLTDELREHKRIGKEISRANKKRLKVIEAESEDDDEG